MNQQNLMKPDEKVQLPAHLQRETQEGFLEDDRGLVAPPRIKIIQAMSDEAGDNRAKPGDVFSTARNAVLPQPVALIPLVEGAEWIAFTEDFQVAWRTTDPKDPRATFEHYTLNVLCWVAGEFEIMSFRSAALRIGRQWHTEAKKKKVPLFAQEWQLTTQIETAKNGKKYFVPVMTWKGFLDQDAYARMKGFYQEYRNTFQQQGVRGTESPDAQVKEGEPAQPDLPF